jgi:peroxiredoxin
LKGEYDTIKDCGGEVIAVSADSLESHDRMCLTIAGCPFPLVSDEGLEAARVYGVAAEDGKRSNRAVFVIDHGGRLLHCIPWYQPGNIGQFMEVFEALGAI